MSRPNGAAEYVSEQKLPGSIDTGGSRRLIFSGGPRSILFVSPVSHRTRRLWEFSGLREKRRLSVPYEERVQGRRPSALPLFFFPMVFQIVNDCCGREQ